ncbi:glycosylation-dependent cell adhesion molecule 1-like [Equus quagga]|uniref:glycosylation-dependent cell adhesion molecule 1-like n=1 Tax=Equus quagga TaxID=89248 RepID=UPI001EE36C2F|nr:glycosylation-dependent cell adhesion molecule 1-like [Equus quagga]
MADGNFDAATLSSLPREDGACYSSTTKLFTIMLLASLASTSLAILNDESEPEDEIHLQSQPTDASVHRQQPPQERHCEDLSKQASTSREELVSEEAAVIRGSGRPKNQEPALLHSTPQGDSFRNAAPRLEETTELPPRAGRGRGQGEEAGQALSRNRDKTMKETMNYPKSLLPRASEVMKP